MKATLLTLSAILLIAFLGCNPFSDSKECKESLLSAEHNAQCSFGAKVEFVPQGSASAAVCRCPPPPAPSASASAQ
jgi:hypothetical protein